MRNPYWRVIARAPFSIIFWSAFGFNAATTLISLAVPDLPARFRILGLSLLTAVVIAWVSLAVRDRKTRTPLGQR